MAAEAALRAWNRLHVSQSYWPISFDVALLLSQWLVRQGWVTTGCAVLLAHRALLRVGEVLRLRIKDMRILGKAQGILRLEHTKTGAEQPVRIEDPGIKTMLRSLIARLTQTGYGPEDFVFNLSYAQLRAQYKSGIWAIGLAGGRVVFHSLRHGGATDLYLSGVGLDNIAHAGRWRSLTTARRYVSTGVALLTQVALSKAQAAVAYRLAKAWPYAVF